MASLKKKEVMELWRDLPENLPLKPLPIPYKHSGTTYGADGIRIEGSREFVEAVLSRLKPLLAEENAMTRLGLAMGEVEARDGRDNDFAGNWACYVKVHVRGGEAQMVNAYASALAGREVIASRGW